MINAFSSVSGIMCVLIDAIITGQFLGTMAVIASGLITPIVTLSNLLCNLLAPGISIVCTRYMGKAQPERSCQVFSIVMIADLFLSGLYALILFAAAPTISGVLGQAVDDQIRQMMSDYMRGYAFSIIPTSMMMGLNGIMMLDNDRKRGLVATLSIFAADVVFDLANVLFFRGGMRGMALATSFGTLVGLLILLGHFLRKNRAIRFTAHGLRWEDLKEVVLCGVSAVISFGSQTLRSFLFNLFLLSVAGSGVVAAFSVANSAFSLVNAIAISVLITTATLCSLLFGEEDRNALTAAISVALRTVFRCFAVITAVMMIFAHIIVGLFLEPSAVGELKQAARFIRFISLQVLLSSFSFVLCGAWQGTRRLNLTYLLSVIREGVAPVLGCLIPGMLFGLGGFETGFIVSGMLTLLSCGLIVWNRSGGFPRNVGNLLLLPRNFGAMPEELFEAEMKTMDEVMAVSHQVMQFCEERNAGKRDAMMTSLFVEEVAGNTVQHGFPNRRAGSVDLRVIYRKDRKIIRFRDNGVPFDPVDWLKRCKAEDPVSGMGISMIVGLAKDAQYVPAMGFNNLMIIL